MNRHLSLVAVVVSVLVLASVNGFVTYENDGKSEHKAPTAPVAPTKPDAPVYEAPEQTMPEEPMVPARQEPPAVPEYPKQPEVPVYPQPNPSPAPPTYENDYPQPPVYKNEYMPNYRVAREAPVPESSYAENGNMLSGYIKNLTSYIDGKQHAMEQPEAEQMESRRYADARAYLPYAELPMPEYMPGYGNQDAHAEHTTVEGEGSYYRLDTCEYRFILDMVQCHTEEHKSEKYSERTNVQDSHHHQHGANYNNGMPQGYGDYGFNGPFDNIYMDFLNLYGNPNAYMGHQRSVGPAYDSLFSFQPAVGHPFYAPGLHNQPFSRYYSGFKAGAFEMNDEAERRNYHKEGHYHSALMDFNNLHLQHITNVTSESEASEKTSTQVRSSMEQAYQGVTPYFNYNVRLMPNHCTLQGYAGRHTCIVFSGHTHPYKMVHRQFIYVKKSHEVQQKYRFRYDDDRRAQQFY